MAKIRMAVGLVGVGATVLSVVWLLGFLFSPSLAVAATSVVREFVGLLEQASAWRTTF